VTELQPAQVRHLDIQLRAGQDATCPTCHVKGQPDVQDRHRQFLGIRIAFPCGHYFTAPETTLEKAL